MNVWESISVALEGLAANKMRAALTMLGVVIGVSAVITMLALAGGARERMMAHIQQMGTNVLIIRPGEAQRRAVAGGLGSIQSLTLQDSEAVADNCPSVAKTAPEVMMSAQVKYGNQNTNTSILGTTPDFLSVRNYRVQKGVFFTNRDVKSLRKVAVIGPTVAKNLFGERPPVGKAISIKGTRFSVIGLMAEKGAGGFGDPDDQIIVPVTTAMRRLFGMQYVRTISAQARSMELMDGASMEITTLLRKRHRIAAGAEDDFVIRNQAEIIEMASEASGTFALLLGGIASVSLLVGGIGIMNIMLVSVTERTREIGIRMAVGARRRDIQNQFLVEAMVLSMVGGVVGILVGMLGSFAITSFSELNAVVSLSSIALSFGFAAFVGIFFGFYPARKASRLNPIDALRYE
ncbi:MAG TPA: ABC transporter permease [Armatimonadota bacterium]|nr:ABC transporter permease [Armatimonadota bacterium]